MLVGSAPGGTTDLVACVLNNSVAKFLSQAIVVENRPGAVLPDDMLGDIKRIARELRLEEKLPFWAAI